MQRSLAAGLYAPDGDGGGDDDVFRGLAAADPELWGGAAPSAEEVARFLRAAAVNRTEGGLYARLSLLQHSCDPAA
eukprot:gene11068-52507_t